MNIDTTLLAKIKAAALILEAVLTESLPMPWSVDTGENVGVTFCLDSLDDVTAWAEWLGKPIKVRKSTSSGYVVHEFDAELYDVALNVRCSVRGAA